MSEITVATKAMNMVFSIHVLNSVSCSRFFTWSRVGFEVQNGEYNGWFHGRYSSPSGRTVVTIIQ